MNCFTGGNWGSEKLEDSPRGSVAPQRTGFHISG